VGADLGSIEDVVDSGSKKLIQRPVAAHVERVYNSGDFADLGIGSP